MSVNADGQPPGRSVLTMLPVVNLFVINNTALHSLLFFEVKQSKNNKLPTYSITFDQPLNVKACKIVMLNNTEIFVCLGGFHQLKSFSGSIGSLMVGSILRRVLEAVHAPITIGNTMTGEMIEMILVSTVLSLLLQEFLALFNRC